MIIVSSIYPPTYQGGLAAYMRLLPSLLEDKFSEGLFFSFEAENPGVPASSEKIDWNISVGDTKVPRSMQRLMMSLAARPLTQWLIPLLASLLFSASHRKVVRKGVRVVHYVGTGWFFEAFSLARQAHKIGARFTIWPAVHPGSWGDDSIDIRLYRMADVVFCQSLFEKEHLISRGLPADRCVLCVLPPMCREDGDGKRLREKFSLGDRPLALFLGRRDEGKGYPAMLEAWRYVVKDVPEAVLLVGGAKSGSFSALVPEDISSSILDLGVIDECLKADALAACDVFCLPSAHESFGIVYVEAWSYGKPVICGTAPASREMVKDGVAGWWGNQEPRELANIIIKALKEPECAARVGARGKTLQQENFSILKAREVHLRAFSAS